MFHFFYIHLNGGILMLRKDNPSSIPKIAFFTAAGTRAAFFVSIFTVMIIAMALVFRQNTADADNVPVAERLGVQIIELENQPKEEPVKAVVKGSEVSEQEAIEIAKELYEEKDQEVVVFATNQTINQTPSASYHEGIEYKVTIKDEVIESIEFDVYRDVEPVQLESEWDLSHNVLDLVTGKVAIEVEMDAEWSKEKILAKAQALSAQIVASNAESGVTSVYLTIQSGTEKYVFDSEHENTLGAYQLIE